VSQTERRCPNCGALVAQDAAWCGQCLQPLPEVRADTGGALAAAPASPPASPPSGTRRAGFAERVPGRLPTWACPVCEHENVIELDRCERCSTPFARLFAEPEPPVRVEPGRAFVWSLILPGLGHWMVGRKPDGVARMVLFAWVFGTLLLLLVSRSGAGLGSTLPIFVVYLVAWLALAGSSAVDARRLAEGREPIVSSRVLLWAAVGLVVVSVLLATFLALPVARGR